METSSPAGLRMAPEKQRGWALGMVWLLGLMFLFPWNSILTIGDYYYEIFPVSYVVELMPSSRV